MKKLTPQGHIRNCRKALSEARKSAASAWRGYEAEEIAQKPDIDPRVATVSAATHLPDDILDVLCIDRQGTPRAPGGRR